MMTSSHIMWHIFCSSHSCCEAVLAVAQHCRNIRLLFLSCTRGNYWERISAESSLVFPQQLKSVKGLNWTELATYVHGYALGLLSFPVALCVLLLFTTVCMHFLSPAAFDGVLNLSQVLAASLCCVCCDVCAGRLLTWLLPPPPSLPGTVIDVVVTN